MYLRCGASSGPYSPKKGAATCAINGVLLPMLRRSSSGGMTSAGVGVRGSISKDAVGFS